tara:strand:- start:29881 stop:30372 length:492 start_codon:yes stop_codon:yes gene_type:complete
MSQLNLNYFEIFGIDVAISIDVENLNSQYLSLQSKFHPDKFVNATNLEKSMATRMSTYINDAYNTLSDLVKRVDYILQINNYSKDEHTTFKNTSFLSEQMMLSEKIENADPSEYMEIKNEISIKIKKIISDMKNNLNNHEFDILFENNSMVKFYKKNIRQLSI